VRSKDAVGGVVMLLFGVLSAALSLQLPLGRFRAPGSGLFPFALGLLLVLLAGLYLGSLSRRGSEGTQAASGPWIPAVGRMPAFLAAIVAATALFVPLGFPATAFVLMASLLRILGMKRWSLVLTVSAIAAVASYGLFVQWLQIPLPKGWIGL
jgi:putative tricarboxylic transport membrane protein